MLIAKTRSAAFYVAQLVDKFAIKGAEWGERDQFGFTSTDWTVCCERLGGS